MLFGDGTGVVAKVTAVANGVITLNTVKPLAEGMFIDFIDEDGEPIDVACGRQITLIERDKKTVRVTGTGLSVATVPVGTSVTLQGSYKNELTGLKAIFDIAKPLYGIPRTNNTWLKPYSKALDGEITELALQTAMDEIEEASGGKVNFIVCSWGVRRSLQKLLSANVRSIDTMELKGGYKAMSYNGVPIVADRFCDDGTMYLLNKDDFTLHQLCDWQWLEGEDGSVLKQLPGKPVYTATLVKYCDLMCDKPYGLTKSLMKKRQKKGVFTHKKGTFRA